MSALLRVLSKDSSGTLKSNLYALDKILSTEISVREQDKDSVESVVGLEGQDNPITFPEYDENKLVITLSDGSETTIDVNEYTACEFEIRDDEGEIVVKTDSLFQLELGLMVAHLKTESTRNKAITALRSKK